MQLQAVNENCSGCRTCLVVCALENFKEINPAKAMLRIQGLFPEPGTYCIHLCDQCGKCADACPEAAIHYEAGVYTVNADECTQCLLCVDECPGRVMRVHQDCNAPFKCTLCMACVDACPRGAIQMIDNNRADEKQSKG